MITHSPEKITSRHRQLHAYVYVRQSTPKQVQHNRESQRNQYALVQRALELGWPAERIHVIDIDRALGPGWPAARLPRTRRRGLAQTGRDHSGV